MSRKTESDIAVIGGVLGVVIGVLSFVVSGVLSLVHLHIQSGLVTSVIAVVIGFIALSFAGLVRKDRLLGGILLIIISVLGFEIVGGLYIISSIIILIAGIIALVEHFR